MKHQFTFTDLFSGIGGFHLALSSLGGRCLYACEKEDHARKIYSDNFHLTPWPNIKTFLKDKPKYSINANHDVMCAGIPCQSYSIAGKKEGLNSENGKLFWDFLKIVKYERPKFIILENVPNMINTNKGKDFKRINDALHQTGYITKSFILESSFFGACQRRKRLYILCFRKGVVIKQQVEYLEIKYPKRKPRYLKDIMRHNLTPKEKAYTALKKTSLKKKFVPTTNIKHMKIMKKKGGPVCVGFINGKKYQYNVVFSDQYLSPTLVFRNPSWIKCYSSKSKEIRTLTINEMRKAMGFPATFKMNETPGWSVKLYGNAVIPKVIKEIVKQAFIPFLR